MAMINGVPSKYFVMLQTDVARELGISRSAVLATEAHALRRLKRIVQELRLSFDDLVTTFD